MPVKTQPGYDTEQIENDLATVRGAHDSLSEYAELTTAVVASVIVADQPGQTHSLAGDGVPMTQETWHSFAPLSVSWSVPGSGYADYRITVNNELQIWAWIKTPGSAVNGVSIATIPVGYRPLGATGFPAFTDTANNAAAAASPGFNLSTAGLLVPSGFGINANVYINVRIPLDTPV